MILFAEANSSLKPDIRPGRMSGAVSGQALFKMNFFTLPCELFWLFLQKGTYFVLSLHFLSTKVGLTMLYHRSQRSRCPHDGLALRHLLARTPVQELQDLSCRRRPPTIRALPVSRHLLRQGRGHPGQTSRGRHQWRNGRQVHLQQLLRVRETLQQQEGELLMLNFRRLLNDDL